MGFFPASGAQSVGGDLSVSGNILCANLTTGAIAATGTISNGGSLSAITAGGSVFSQLGSIDVQSAGNGLKVKEGANAKQGIATLAAGTVTVANTSVTANSRIFLTNDSPGGTIGFLSVSAKVAGASFTITSSNALDTSVVAYEIFEPG